MGHLILALFGQFNLYLCIIIAYLLGSIPTSYLIGRIFFGQDIRQSGSGNTGATNALRTFGTKVGVFVLLIDMLKGIAAILIAGFIMKFTFSGEEINFVVSLSGLFVILGHVFSIFLKFKGGKGVATAAGVFLALSPISFLFCLVLFAFIVYSTKFVSLGSILSAGAFLLIEVVSQSIMRFPNLPRLILVVIVLIMIIIRHKSNIKRLVNGVENRINFKKEE